MTLIRAQAARGELGNTSLTFTGRKILPIEQLVEDPENERKTFDDMDDLVASIRAVGTVVEALTVIKLDNNTYQIVTGHRRFRAAKSAGLRELEVLVREPEEKWLTRKKSLISNVQRADIRALELAESLNFLMENDPGIKTQEDLARAIGKDKSWVSQMLRILDLPAELKAKVGTSQLFISADAVSKIARLDDPALQATLIDELLAGGTVRDIRGRIDVAKGKTPAVGEAFPLKKEVFHAKNGIDIIVQAHQATLSKEDLISALQDALRQARKPKPVQTKQVKKK